MHAGKSLDLKSTLTTSMAENPTGQEELCPSP
jgi:hypothetical protein